MIVSLESLKRSSLVGRVMVAVGEEIETRQQPIKITYGYSRDRRPDLKQFMIDLIVSGDGDVYFYLFVDKRSGYMRAYTSKTKSIFNLIETTYLYLSNEV